jgi:hypothetical protein
VAALPPVDRADPAHRRLALRNRLHVRNRNGDKRGIMIDRREAPCALNQAIQWVAACARHDRTAPPNRPSRLRLARHLLFTHRADALEAPAGSGAQCRLFDYARRCSDRGIRRSSECQRACSSGRARRSVWGREAKFVTLAIGGIHRSPSAEVVRDDAASPRRRFGLHPSAAVGACRRLRRSLPELDDDTHWTKSDSSISER